MILGFSGGVDVAKELGLQCTQGGLTHNLEKFSLLLFSPFFSAYRVPSPISISNSIDSCEVREFNIMP